MTRPIHKPTYLSNVGLLQREKWNESGFRPVLCTYRLNWARRTSWEWWDDTALQTQDSKFKPWRSEGEHAISWSRRFPTILSFTSGWGRNILVTFKPPRPWNEPRTSAWKAAVLNTTQGLPPTAWRKSSPWIWKGVFALYKVADTPFHIQGEEIINVRPTTKKTDIGLYVRVWCKPTKQFTVKLHCSWCPHQVNIGHAW